MAIVIREAVEEDYETLCDIIDQLDELHRDALPQLFKAAEGPVRTRAFILNAIRAPDIGLFVAEVEHCVAGFVHVLVRETRDVPIFVPRRYAAVDSLAVRTAYRRRGVGRALMEKAHAWSRSRGATSIELRVYAFNQSALDFYQSLGYELLSQSLSKSLDGPEPGRKGR